MSLSISKSGIRPGREQTLSYAEEKQINERIKQLEEELNGKEIQQGLKFEPRDVSTIQKWLANYKRIHSQGGAQRYEGKERVQAEMELRRIEAEITKAWGGKIPTFQEYWMTPKAGLPYLQLVERIRKFNSSRLCSELIRRWKAIRRRLWPDDETADNVLHLFSR